MASDDLLTRTAYPRNQHPMSSRLRRQRRYAQPSHDYLNAFRSPLQSLERTTLDNTDPEAESDESSDSTPAAAESNLLDLAGDFQVTTDYDQNSEGSGHEGQQNEDEQPSVAEIEELQIDQEEDFLCSENDEDEIDNTPPGITGSLPRRRHRELLRRVREIEARSEIARQYNDPELARQYVQYSLRDRDLLKPNARFFIERGKSKVSIKFDPPP